MFGLIAGIKPGPLGILVIQQTLECGLKQGLRASLAPIVTDGPIIFLALIVLTQIQEMTQFAGLLSFAGGLYLLWLALKMFKLRDLKLLSSAEAPKSLSTAIKINLLNPNPYLFWFTVGGSYIALGTYMESIAFVVTTVGTLVLSKMMVAWVAFRFKKLLNTKIYLWVMRVLGIWLATFGIIFLSKSSIVFSSP